MNWTFILGAVLVALLMVLPALIHKHHWKILREFYATRDVFRQLVRNLLCEELGAITTTYYNRGAGRAIRGSTTPCTGAQASALEVQKAVIAWGAATDTAATFTHNWGLDASAPDYADPDASYVLLVDHTYMPSLVFTFLNVNAVLVTKAVTTGPCTVLITLRRNSTEGQ
jgi:hypothetical protein